MHRFLAYGWLVFSALWIRGGVAFFREAWGVSGPNTGGLLLIFPLAALAILLGACGVFIGLSLGVSRPLGRKLAVVASVLGLILTAAAVPIALFAMIGLMVIFESGYVLSGLALVATPLLFVVTLVLIGAVKEGAPINRRTFLVVGSVIVASAFLPNWQWSWLGPRKVSEEERAQTLQAINAADEKVLAKSEVWDVYFDDGDPLQTAIGLKKPKAARILLSHLPIGRTLTLYRDRALDAGNEEILQLLADEHADFADDGAMYAALRAVPLTSLRFHLAHGGDAQKALCVLSQGLGIDDALVKPRRDLLVAAGASEAKCRAP